MSTLRLPTCVIDLERRTLTRTSGAERISRREAELLTYLAAKNGELVSREELEREVWKFAPGVRSEAVPVAMRRLRARIEVDAKSPRILLTEYARGWRLNLETPAPTEDTLLGRAAALTSIATGWERASLQVVVGPGGVGKTTLARAACPDGGVFVDLSHATTGAQCLEAIRSALPGLQLQGLEEAETLARLRFRLEATPMTVLDNAEQVVEPLSLLIPHFGEARLLVTSRQRLGVHGERVVPLSPLESSDAVSLFRSRYRLAGGRAELDSDELAEVVELIDGLPLAIELLAPRARVLPLPELASRLALGVDEIPSIRGRTDRHSSMRNCIAWSWQALDKPTKNALRAAATFATPFSFHDLAQVYGKDPIDPLERLTDSALVVIQAPGLYTLRVLVRSFVAGKSDTNPFNDRHASLFVQRLQELRHGVERLPTLVRITPELQQVVGRASSESLVLRAALGVHEAMRGEGLAQVASEVLHVALKRTTTTRRQARLQLAMAEATQNVPGGEAERWLKRVKPEHLEDPSEFYTVWTTIAMRTDHPPPPHREHGSAVAAHPTARSLTALALAHWLRGDTADAHKCIRRAARLARESPNVHARVYTLRAFHGLLADEDSAAAATAIQEALKLAEAASMTSEILHCRANLAVHLSATNRQAASETFAQVEQEHKQLGDRSGAAHARANRAINQWFLGDSAAAWALFETTEFEKMRPLMFSYSDLFRQVAGFEQGVVSASELEHTLQTYEEPDSTRARTLTALLGARLLQWPLTLSLDELEASPSLPDITSCVSWIRNHSSS